VYKYDTLWLVICRNECVETMELVETIRDVEAVVHCLGCIVDVCGGRTGMAVNDVDEGLSDLKGAHICTPLGTANTGAVQVDIRVDESPGGSMRFGRSAPR